jgi:hypothetical protein
VQEDGFRRKSDGAIRDDAWLARSDGLSPQRIYDSPGTPWAYFEDYTVLEDCKPKKLYCFLTILGYSRMQFVTDMTTNTMIRCHQNAFRYFGGYPEEMLYHGTTGEIPFERLKKEGLNHLKREYIIDKINLRRVQIRRRQSHRLSDRPA